MKSMRLLIVVLALGALSIFGACANEEPIAAEQPEQPEQNVNLLALSNDSPHITVIDAETNLVTNTTDITDITKWTWNDDNNYFDGKNVWLGLKYPENDDAVVIALNVNTLEVVSRISVGKESKNIYIGKSTKDGILHVGKQASAEVVTIDTKTMQVVDTWVDMPVNEGGVVCDADIGVGPDGVERFYYPTLGGDSVVSVDAKTGEILQIVSTPEGSKPVMHTNAPDGKMWVQEIGSHTNAVFDPVTLDLVKRFPAAQKPVVATFSPDGSFAYIGHSGDPVVQVVDTQTLTEVKQITVGNTPTKIAVHPNGEEIYAIASKEGSIAVIDTGNWTVTGRITLDSNPGGLFLWTD